MTEYYTVKRIDNSRLMRSTEPARLREFWRRVAAGAGMAGCLLFYAWQHFECIQLRYQLEQLESRHTPVPGQVAPAEEASDAVLAQARAIAQPSRP